MSIRFNNYGEEEVLVSVILPCRNEEAALSLCLAEIKKVLAQENINGEIIVSDSSVDNSARIAEELGVRLVKHDQAGYGLACQQGFAAAKGKYLFLADADGTYDFKEIPRFLAEVSSGNDLVIGNRFAGKMEKGAMPFLNRYLGNPLLSTLFRLFFRLKIIDVQSGMRAITREALDKLDLRTLGMEFATEMMIKAAKAGLKVKEVAINYHKRQGKSKLKRWADGWRHIRFMLLFSPLFLFFLPGLILFSLGALLMFILYIGAFRIFGISFGYHPMFFASLLIISGYQLIIFSFFSKIYAINHLRDQGEMVTKLYRYLTIEKASLAGLIFIALGAIIYGVIFFEWLKTGFGPLSEVKNSIIALTLIVIGLQTIFSSFVLSILGIKEK
ncbi:MAG TPA: glycosyltransferase family 2 protein [Patescibacteria group bacterium]|nr:glycosyltransferase family 2 protein [Patescibacteria group bacterium]